MPLSFRRSLAFGPLRLNFSRSGIALSAGVRGARVSVGPRGTYVSFGAGGFYYRAKLDEANGSAAPRTPPSRHPPGAPWTAHPGPGPEGLIATAPIDMLARAAPDSVTHDIEARAGRMNLFKVFLWVIGITLLLAIGSPLAFVSLLALAVTAGFFVQRWDRERRTARIFYDVDNDEIVGRLALCNVAGEALARTASLWHVFASNATIDRKYHAGAGSLIRRTPTRCALGSLDGVAVNLDCWSISVGPQQMLFLPDRLLVREQKRYASIQYDSLIAVHETTRFIEDGRVPTDTQVIDTTWRFVNKSGGPDLRFNNNPRLPVVAYGELTLRSSTGLQIVVQSSNPIATQSAATALQELARIARDPAPPPSPPPWWTGGPRAQPDLDLGPRGPIDPPVSRAPPEPAWWADGPRAPQAVAVGPRAPVDAELGGPDRQLSPAQGAAPPRLPAAAPDQAHIPPTYANPFAAARPRPISSVPPPLPPPVPFLRAPPRAAVSAASSAARFFGPAETLAVAERTIRMPLTYVATSASNGTDASTIVTSLRVGDGSRALPLHYWPRYSEADPDQRARYLDWMAAGRTDPSLPVGYAFIFFYGLERRALLDDADHDLARAEVIRLLGIHGESRSFRHYASDFLAFTALRRQEQLLQMPEAGIAESFRPLLSDSTFSLPAIVGWYQAHARPLPAEYAAFVARGMENSKRGTVVTRSAVELSDLFSIRYRESFGDGLVLEAAKRPLKVEYHPASATLLGLGRSLSAALPDVLGRTGQFRRLVSVWNDCIDDLRKASAKKRGATTLDAAAWSALPVELRAEYDHPDQDRWDAMFTALPVLDRFRLTQAGPLGALVGAPRGEKLTPAQMRKVAARAEDVGYSIEPDPRLRSKAADWDTEVLIWRAPGAAAPDPRTYGAIVTVLSLAMAVAMADGVFTREEQDVVNSFLAELFTLDDGMRVRVEAMKQLMARDPARLGTVAKSLRATRSPSELAKIAAVLVAIAAADGTIAQSEESALRAIYRNLGLPPGDLEATIVRTGARLERDATVEAQHAGRGAGGVAIPPPPGQPPPSFQLDRAAIEAIVADTKEVAAMLAEVFEDESEEQSFAPIVAPESSATLGAPTVLAGRPLASEATARLAKGLDVRYHAVLESLLMKDAWTNAEVKSMAEHHRLMPAAILDTINAWSDDALGDFIIDDVGDWKINRELAKAGA